MRLTEEHFLLVDWLLNVLVRAANKPVLIISDEVQELFRADDNPIRPERRGCGD